MPKLPIIVGERVRTIWAAIAAVTVLGLAGCSGDPEPPAVTSPADGASTPAVTAPSGETALSQELSKEQAAAALLVVDDLPPGWTGGQTPEQDTAGDLVASPEQCTGLLGGGPSFGLADADFADGGEESGLAQRLYRMKQGTAGDRLDLVREALRTCTTYVDDQENRFQVRPMSFPAAGDDTVAVREVMGGGEFRDELVFVSVRGIVMRFVSYGNSDRLTEAELAALVQKAVARVQAA